MRIKGAMCNISEYLLTAMQCVQSCLKTLLNKLSNVFITSE